MKRAIQVGLVKPVTEEVTETQIDVEAVVKETFRGISNVIIVYMTYDTCRKIVLDWLTRK